MSVRARILAYGSAALLIVAGAVCAAAVAGQAGELLALVLIGLGFVGITGLVFLEVGLSEDRDREQASRGPRSARLKRPGRHLDRLRGERRRLR